MIYLDHAATGRVYPEVLEVENSAELTYYGNPSSLHKAGYLSSRALENARNSILNAFGVAKTSRLIFTSGATEANNLICKGIAFRYANRGKKILTTNVEHPSIANALKALIPFGFEIVEMPVNEKGVLTQETLLKHIDKNTILVTVIGVNNETGAINDLKMISDVVKGYPKCFFHSDLTQAIGKTRIAYGCLDAFSFSAHKFGGRKGEGGLVMKKSLSPSPVLDGGAQEEGIRAGTVNVSGALGMAKALELSMSGIDEKIKHARTLYDALKSKLIDMGETSFNSTDEGSPFILNFSLKTHKASVIVEGLSERDIYVSSVSACSSKKEPISHVLLAMGRNQEESANALRVSFGYETTLDDIDAFVAALESLLKEVHAR